MTYIDFLQNDAKNGSNLVRNATGMFYTGEIAGKTLALKLAHAYYATHPDVCEINVVDPFGGDGRLLEWLIRAYKKIADKEITWKVELWDYSENGFCQARDRLENVDANIDYQIINVDSFQYAQNYFRQFDMVITNPPWETLKPDKREIKHLSHQEQNQYISHLKAYDTWLNSRYPKSKPKSKFAGWGTNLSRVGMELCLALAKREGFIGIVMPASLMADDQSLTLREHIFADNSIHKITFYPAKSKLYEDADIDSITMVINAGDKKLDRIEFCTYNNGTHSDNQPFPVSDKLLKSIHYSFPVSFGSEALNLLWGLKKQFASWKSFENKTKPYIWAGREIDETGSASWLIPKTSDLPMFIKGRMVQRYRIVEEAVWSANRPQWKPPKSIGYARIAWRDVSRLSQKRRMIATIIPEGFVAGNSLNTVYFTNGDTRLLKNLLGVMLSTVFEFQLRAYLATTHVSLSSIRKVAIPAFEVFEQEQLLCVLVDEMLQGSDGREFCIDAYVAKKIYELDQREYSLVIDQFDKFTEHEKGRYLEAFSKEDW